MRNLGKIITYKTHKWELWLSKILPYWLPFISKRRRVEIKWYWKHRGGRRACTAMTKALMMIKYQEPKDWHKIEVSDWEWEVITPKKDKQNK